VNTDNVMHRSPWKIATRILPLLLLALPGAGGPQPEEIEFWRPPPEGLYFSSARLIKAELDGAVRAGELGTQRMKQNSEYFEDFTEKVLPAETDGVTKFTREYVRAYTKSQVVTDRMLIPHQDRQDELYAALDFQAVLKDGEVELWLSDPERLEGERLVRAEGIEDELKHLFTYPHPVLPADHKPRRVGDAWSLDESALKKLFPRRPADGLQGTLKVTFARIDPSQAVNFSTVTKKVDDEGQISYVLGKPVEKPVRCAVLETKGTLSVRAKDRLPLTLELEGTYHYSIAHQVIVKSKLTGKIHIQGTLRKHAFDFPGTYSDVTQVEFHKEVAEDKTGAGDAKKDE